MALKFDNKEIPGEHGPIVFGSPELVVRRFQVFQIRGEGEIRGRTGGRSLSVRVLLHDKYTGDTPDKLLKKLEEFDDKWVGVNGTLEETGNVERKLNYCTFDGWQPVAEEGQAEPGPLLDVAGTLDATSNGAPIYGWFQMILLQFRQLRK